jgi:hypothetical protein
VVDVVVASLVCVVSVSVVIVYVKDPRRTIERVVVVWG